MIRQKRRKCDLNWRKKGKKSIRGEVDGEKNEVADADEENMVKYRTQNFKHLVVVAQACWRSLAESIFAFDLMLPCRKALSILNKKREQKTSRGSERMIDMKNVKKTNVLRHYRNKF